MQLKDVTPIIKAILEERDKIPRIIDKERYIPNPQPYHDGDFMRGGIRKALRVIEQAPVVDAVPVAHGRWVRANDEQAYFDVEYVCSGCQFVVAVSGIGTPILYGYKFCPHCGMTMDAKDMDVPTKDGGAEDAGR